MFEPCASDDGGDGDDNERGSSYHKLNRSHLAVPFFDVSMAMCERLFHRRHWKPSCRKRRADPTSKAIAKRRRARGSLKIYDRAIARDAILDLQASSRSSWLSFHRSRESIRNVCDAAYRVDASRRRAICAAIRRDLACL